MVNTRRAQVEVDIGGKLRLMRFDMNALSELEAAFDKPLADIFQEDKVGVRVLRECLFVGLRTMNKRLKVGEVGGMMEPDKLGYYGEKIAEALGLAMGVDREETEPDPLPNYRRGGAAEEESGSTGTD